MSDYVLGSAKRLIIRDHPDSLMRPLVLIRLFKECPGRALNTGTVSRAWLKHTCGSLMKAT